MTAARPAVVTEAPSRCEEADMGIDDRTASSAGGLRNRQPIQEWTVRVGPARREPFSFEATFQGSGTSRGVLDARYLYGDGDLAVFLEDLGAETPAIWRLLDSLHATAAGEIAIAITDEAMEVLVRGKRG
jgi:hypothetical protein